MFLINLKIELNKQEQEYDDWIINCSYSLANLRLKRQSVICLLKEKDENNINIVFSNERKD